MQTIPVLDVTGGHVVRGAGGDRANYRPIETPLAPGSDPAAVAAGLMTLYAFPALYLADLDAIAGHEPAYALYDRLRRAHPGTALWVDCGIASRGAAVRVAEAGLVPVAGSETLADPGFLAEPDWRGRAILSLDHGAEGPRGDPALFASAAGWSDRVIVMTLSRVGAGGGPDLAAFGAAKALAAAAGREPALFAAGGVRGPEDLDALREAGAAGVLVASALHDGRLTATDLERAAGP